MQRLVGRMEPYEGLIRLLSMTLTASPLIDFDSAYVAREILEGKLESKRDVYRYGVFQLVLNHISYICGAVYAILAADATIRCEYQAMQPGCCVLCLVAVFSAC